MRKKFIGFGLLRLFWNDFKRQRKRIMLTILALSWGAMTIILLLSVGEGIGTQFIRGSRGLGEGIVILNGGQTRIPYQGFPKGRRISLTEEDVALLEERIPEIEFIGAEYDRGGNTIVYGKKTRTQRVNGVYPSFEFMRTHYSQRGGRFIHQLDMDLKRRVAFLGSSMKKQLFGDEEAVGKTILINDIPFVVVGVMIKKLQTSMYGGPDEDRVVIPASTFKTMFGHRYVNRIIYKPADAALARRVERKVYEVLGAKYRFDPKDTQALRLWDVIENEKIFEKILLGMKLFMMIIGVLTLIVGGVGVANIMYIAVRQRTREVGIKMALGAKRRHIMSQFLSEALLIVAAGGLGGLFPALLLISVMRIIPAQGMVWDYFGHPVFTLEIAMVTVIVLSAIGILAGFFPARKASRLNPIESLRYE